MQQSLFDYRLRHSARARGVRLRVSVEHGLEVIVPPRFNLEHVPVLLDEKAHWIRRALERAAANRHLLGIDLAWQLPSEIVFPAFERCWRIETHESDSRSVRVRTASADGLSLSGAINDESACRLALGRWWLRTAEPLLLSRLQALSLRLQLPYASARIRRQRSRWGSCSRNRTINLNAKLVFQPPALMDYVLIHELCHLEHLNHSGRFWALVERHDPDYRAHDRALRDGWRHVPRWAR